MQVFTFSSGLTPCCFFQSEPLSSFALRQFGHQLLHSRFTYTHSRAERVQTHTLQLLDNWCYVLLLKNWLPNNRLLLLSHLLLLLLYVPLHQVHLSRLCDWCPTSVLDPCSGSIGELAYDFSFLDWQFRDFERTYEGCRICPVAVQPTLG
jgi:hypothetical protein